MNDIDKIKYTFSYFDLSEMKSGARTVTEIFSDGFIQVSEYGGGSRKRIAKNSYTCSAKEFDFLCSEIKACIESADRLTCYICDADAEVTIYHRFSRIEKMNHALGNEYSTVGSIIEQFIDKHIK